MKAMLIVFTIALAITSSYFLAWYLVDKPSTILIPLNSGLIMYITDNSIEHIRVLTQNCSTITVLLKQLSNGNQITVFNGTICKGRLLPAKLYVEPGIYILYPSYHTIKTTTSTHGNMTLGYMELLHLPTSPNLINYLMLILTVAAIGLVGEVIIQLIKRIIPRNIAVLTGFIVGNRLAFVCIVSSVFSLSFILSFHTPTFIQIPFFTSTINIVSERIVRSIFWASIQKSLLDKIWIVVLFLMMAFSTPVIDANANSAIRLLLYIGLNRRVFAIAYLLYSTILMAITSLCAIISYIAFLIFSHLYNTEIALNVIVPVFAIAMLFIPCSLITYAIALLSRALVYIGIPVSIVVSLIIVNYCLMPCINTSSNYGVFLELIILNIVCLVLLISMVYRRCCSIWK